MKFNFLNSQYSQSSHECSSRDDSWKFSLSECDTSRRFSKNKRQYGGFSESEDYLQGIKDVIKLSGDIHKASLSTAHRNRHRDLFFGNTWLRKRGLRHFSYTHVGPLFLLTLILLTTSIRINAHVCILFLFTLILLTMCDKWFELQTSWYYDKL